MIIDLNSKTLTEGDYKKTLTLQTNDPDNSFIIIALICVGQVLLMCNLGETLNSINNYLIIISI